MNPPRALRIAGPGFGAALLLAYACALLAHRTPPSLTDFANWTYQGVLLHDHIAGIVDTAHALKTYPVPNSAATVGIALLAFLFPWPLAAKAWLCAQLLVSFATVRRVLRVTGGSAWAWFIVPQSVFLNMNFWYGFLNFQLGLCWVMLLAATLLERARGGRGADGWVGLLLVAAFFTHMLSFCACVLLVLCFALQTRKAALLWQTLPASLLSCWYLAGRFLIAHNVDGQAGMQPAVRDYSAAFWLFKVNSYLKSFGFVNPGAQDVQAIGRAAFLFFIAVNLSLAVLLGVQMLRAAKHSWTTQNHERFLWWAILALLPPYLFAPGSALGVSDPGARLLQIALALGIVLCVRVDSVRLRVCAAAATGLSGLGLAMFLLLAFHPSRPSQANTALPARVVEFGHIPNDDQDYFYEALSTGDHSLQVFPTGIFFNRGSKPVSRAGKP